jgi:general secretion pathway protein G
VALTFFLGICFVWSCTQSVSGEKDSIQRSREAVLRQNLFTLRSLIQQYTLDKQKAPQSLDDLVSAGYLKQIPKDPITRKTDWKIIRATELPAEIVDIQSSSSELAWDGTRYNSW